MLTRKESGTSRASWLTAVGCIALLLCVGVVRATPLPNVQICHKGHSIVVNANSLPAHLAHGDRFGTCDHLCACPAIFDPVTCESNGRTYVNLCLAACDGATDCARPTLCACPNIWDPIVCDGITYANLCIADCLNAPSDCGTGPGVCACPLIFAPVTCSDGATYVNQCTADCFGATGCTAACAEPNNPVICTTGHTYDNLCLGRLAGEECYYIDNAVICDVANCPPFGCPGFSPVICPNGASYANACVADCCLHSQTNGCRSGSCLLDAHACTEHDPVTCANGKTYTNPCYATCDGATGCAP